jgi:iron(III) transport system substrate-binding protein
MTSHLGKLAGLVAVLLMGAGCGSAQAPASGAAGASAAAASIAGGSALDTLYQAAKSEGEVIWASSTQADALNGAKDSFERQFPGIKLTITTLDSSNHAQRMITESQAKRVSVDVSTSGPIPMQALVGRDLIENVDVSGIQAKPDDILDGRMLINGDSIVGWLYNTKLVAEKDAPAKFEDFLDPKWKGKMTIEKAGSGFDMLLGMWDDAQIQSFLTDLVKQAPVPAATSQEALNRVALGESLFAQSSYLTASDKVRDGAPLGVLPIRALGSPSGSYVVKGEPHPKATQLLLAWMTTQAGKDALATAGIGRFNECGPLAVDKLACGKHIQMYYVDTLEKSQKINEHRARVVKTLGFA